MERKLTQKATFIIIQDLERAKVLASDNLLPLQKFLFLPNAPLGKASKNFSHYWHKKLQLPASAKIVLHAGSLEKWTGIREIIRFTHLWPKNWILIVHTREKAENSLLIEELKKLDQEGRVIFSLSPVSKEEYLNLVQGADIGLAFYIPYKGTSYTQTNLRKIGLSCGKLAYYLKCGLPVVVNKDTNLSEIVEKANCGVVVNNAKEIGKAIEEISSNYNEYSKNACKTFEKCFNFEKAFQKVLEKLEEV